MNWRLVSFGALAVLGAVAVVMLGGERSGGRAEAAGRAPGLHAFGSCDRLRSYLSRHRAAFKPSGVEAMPGILAEEDAAAGSPAEAAPAPAPGSPTNVQEEGVDEPDIVKTAGDAIVTVDGQRLRAVDSNGGSPVLLDSIELPGGPGEDSSADYQLLATGDHLLAIGTSYRYPIGIEGDVGVAAPDVDVYGEPRTVLAEVDISDPSSLRVTESMTVDGSYVSARLTGSTVRLATSSYPTSPVAGRRSGRALLPDVRVRDHATGERTHGKLFGCRAVDRPSRFAGTGMLTVSTIDLEQGLPAVDADSVLTDGQILYASPTALYVATERWDPGADPSSDSQVSTQIHRFDISDPQATAYVASGKVSGYMLSQWSMSEQDGLLRVASTTSPPWASDGSQQGESESFVTVLAPDGDRLRAVGRVGGLGRGEDIYAVRFAGDTGYVVTFRQVDPLYVLDLSDPVNPRTVGELKIPGYSAYLHPVGPGLILGVGREVSLDGVPGGVQISLFDVTDPAAPVRLDRESFGDGSTTEVEYDHHAFSWFEDTTLATLPIDAYAYAGEEHSLVGLRVTPGAADPLGRVAKVARASQVRRTLELGGRVYAVGADGVAAYEPATLAQVGSLAY